MGRTLGGFCLIFEQRAYIIGIYSPIAGGGMGQPLDFKRACDKDRAGTPCARESMYSDPARPGRVALFAWQPIRPPLSRKTERV